MVRDKPLSFEREIRFAAISQISPKTVQDNWSWGYSFTNDIDNESGEGLR